MLSHILTVSNINQFYEGLPLEILRVALHAATPAFIMLFGAMLSIVYLPRFEGDKRREISVRLISRAIQCWLLYCLSVAILYIFRADYSLYFSISTALMLGVTPFTDILKFYAVMLALAPLLLMCFLRYPLILNLAAAAVIHLAYPILALVPGPGEFGSTKEISRLAEFLFGIGHASLAGPSVIHGLSLVILGMALGKWLKIHAAEHGPLLGLLAISLISLGLWVLVAGPEILSRRALILRAENHPAYFITGALSACILTSLALLAATCGQTDAVWRKATFFGRVSLFTFSFGNMILYVLPTAPKTMAGAVALVIALSLAVTSLSFTFDRAMQHGGLAVRIVESGKTIIYRATSYVFGIIISRIPERATG